MPTKLRICVTAAAALGVLAGYAAGTWQRAPGAGGGDPATAAQDRVTAAAPDTPTTARGDQDELAALRTALEEERDRVALLEFEAEMLRSFVEAQSKETAEAPAATAAGRDEQGSLPGATTAGAERDWFDQDSLISRGIDAQRATWLEERFEELQMAELYLRDEAMRGGWVGTRRHRDELRRLRADTFEALGEEDYDLLLFAAGRNNRVVVKSVLKSSPAADVGIEPGDILERYGDEKIFTPLDLIEAPSKGDPDRSVPLVIVRDGEPVRVSLPRGPLGIRIAPGRRFPADAAR